MPVGSPVPLLAARHFSRFHLPVRRHFDWGAKNLRNFAARAGLFRTISARSVTDRV